jgi:hypothetical protein
MSAQSVVVVNGRSIKIGQGRQPRKRVHSGKQALLRNAIAPPASSQVTRCTVCASRGAVSNKATVVGH